jgi:acyl-CoA thioester hydrolase
MIHPNPLETLPKLTESRVIVRFQDCDPLNHLNNAKYFDYFFNAREDQISKLYDFKFSEVFFNYKTSWVVYQSRIAYVRPAMVSEWVKIYSRLILAEKDTVVTEFFMTDEATTHLKTLLWVKSKYVDVATGQKTNHQDEVQNYLDATLVPELNFYELDFDQRVRSIKQEIRQGLKG